MEEIWPKDLQNSQNFRLRRNFGFEKLFCGVFGITKKCIEMHKMLSGNKKLLEKIHLGEKYKRFEHE